MRFTHSLVMSILFSHDPMQKRIKKILQNTYEHSSKLGSFVFIFKSLVCLLTKIQGRPSPLNHAISGFFTGLVWSKDTPVNTQISFYLFSRSLVGNVKLLRKKGVIPACPWLEKNSFCILTVICWGIVMYLFEAFPGKLQSSLVSSMDFLYHDSDQWRGWKYCIPYCNQFLEGMKFITS